MYAVCYTVKYDVRNHNWVGVQRKVRELSGNLQCLGIGRAQWCRQDLLRGGAKMEMSWALTANFWAGCSSCLMTNSFVTYAALIERAVSC